MDYNPRILFNPKDTRVEFMFNHQTYIFEPGEKKLLSGEAADHAIRFVNTGLKPYEPESDDMLVASSTVAYDKMKWRELISLASARGLYSPGPGKDKKYVIKALVQADDKGK